MDFPAIEAVLAGPIPALIQAEWAARAAEISDTGDYAASTSFVQEHPYHGNPLSCAVLNTSKHAQFVETGHTGFHLPERVDWGGPKVKTSKSGRHFLVIPFRHSSPGRASGGLSRTRIRTMMPAAVHREALAMARTAAMERRVHVAANAARLALARQRLEAAGPRLSRPYALFRAHGEAVPAHLGRGYTWKAPKYAGLVRTEQENPKTGKTSGQFFTFRTMTEDSTGFWIGPTPGHHIARDTVDAVKGHLRELVGEAARDDLVRLVEAA